jgi:serine palmitoyltransferase
MDIDHAQEVALHYAVIALEYIERIPGSGIVLRYIRSSYQDDPIRSVIELVLFLFTVRYLLTPSYSTKKPVKEHLTEEVRPRYSNVNFEHVTYTE